MNWQEMFNDTKDRLIHEKVMGKPTVCYRAPISSMHYQSPNSFNETGGYYQEWTCSGCGAYGYGPTPAEHPVPVIPPYTYKWDATWPVLQYAAAHFEDGSEQQECFAHALSGTFEIKEKTGCYEYTDYPLWELLDISHWTPDSVCRAVLVGLGVLDEQGNLKEEQA